MQPRYHRIRRVWSVAFFAPLQVWLEQPHSYNNANAYTTPANPSRHRR